MAKEVSRDVLLTILKTLGAEFTDKITLERATEKVKRIAKKKGLPDDAEWDEDQTKTLKLLGIKVGESEEEDSEDEESEDEEKPSKKSKKEKKKGKKKKSKAKREGNVEKMKRLLAEGKDMKEISKIFFADYKEAGKTDKDWIEKRIEIYHNLATGTKKKKLKKKGKKSKESDGEEKSEKKGKKKKLKKKAKEEETEEDADE